MSSVFTLTTMLVVFMSNRSSGSRSSQVLKLSDYSLLTSISTVSSTASSKHCLFFLKQFESLFLLVFGVRVISLVFKCAMG
ncbi:hypothetical protein EDC96DRAFT_516645 [Choanephora cucurbitarum]|nr:hypothetical protein EDC96DRAFT_516645 [Choanephora cucurbitarum]